MVIKIGTSGYSFEDWRGNFYPEKIEKGKMLDYYLKVFPTVEINSTYYRIPHPAVMANIDRKTPAGFEFIVKTPDKFTHKRLERDEARGPFLECLKPMQESGKLKGVLAQFPYSFKYSISNLKYVAECSQDFPPDSFFVEFRHSSWDNPDTFKALKSARIPYVSVDEPQLPGLLKPELEVSTSIAYIRLHGRNAAQWWDGGALRYDYDYSDQELEEWRSKVIRLEGQVSKTFIFFNNCHLGQAVKNARQMMAKLNL